MIVKSERSMITPSAFKQRSAVSWEVPASYRPDMHVPARVYASPEMFDTLFVDRSLEQLINVATLPGIVGAALAMPDIHEGYGFPIGGVAATRYPHGIISPGGIGYDINCGVRLLRSSLSIDDIRPHLERLAKSIYKWVPSGVGRGGSVVLTTQQLNDVLRTGAGWAVANGHADARDLAHIESGGVLADADPNMISEQAKERGADQLGTIGAGNHFVEVDFVDETFDPEVAHAFGLFKGQVVVLIHTGSRGLGHQVATDHLRVMVRKMSTYGIELPDRELAGVPYNSLEGQQYAHAMAAAANFAWANRSVITGEVRSAWREIFGPQQELEVVYDVSHNIAKIEEHMLDGELHKLIVHRKGATRAFGPGHPEIAEEYRAHGQPVLIPGSMGTASYVLVGTNHAMTETFGSCCHGAGRVLSRHAARKTRVGREVRDELFEQGIHVQAGSIVGLSEEAPGAYKDIESVVRVVHDAGIARRVARLRPCAVIKG